MKKGKIIKLVAVFLILTLTAMSQRKRQLGDTVSVYREFAKLGQWYQQVPLHINLHFLNKTVPAANGLDSAETDMVLYYGKNDFYMQAEGMEQIANDTILVLVNNEAKMIKIYPHNGAAQMNLQRTAMMFMADSSFNSLVDRYSAGIQDEGKNRKRITLQSREKVFGTDFPKETISVSYERGSYQPVTFDQSKRTLLPIDSSVYFHLVNDQAYNGKLVSTKAKENFMYFLVKEQHTACRFTNINHDLREPPVKQQDRVTRLSDGTYQPAKELVNYILSKEF